MLSAGYEVPPQLARKAMALSKRFPNFHFADDALPREEVYALWNLVDVFISAPVYDGYSAALAEGRYIGAVPIVNQIPGNQELIREGENGWFCHPFTASNLVDRIKLALQMPKAKREAFAGLNRSWIEAHSLVAENAKLFLRWCKELKTK